MSNKEEILLDGKAVNMLKETVGGTTVVANPELSGEEPNLEGLEVGGVKYKVPEGGGIEYVTVARNNPEIDYSDYQKLLAGAYIRIDNQQEAEWNSSEIICLPNHNADELVYTSTVKDDKYYKVVVTVLDYTEAEFEATCTITEHSVGGGGSAKYTHKISARLRLDTNEMWISGTYVNSSQAQEIDGVSALGNIISGMTCSGYTISAEDGAWASLNGLYFSNGGSQQIIGASYDVDNGIQYLLFADNNVVSIGGATSLGCIDIVE